VNSLYGTSPAFINIRIIVEAKKEYVFNAAPRLLSPPEGVNLVLVKSEEKFSVTVPISDVFDDNDRPAYLNFSNRDLGQLSYKFTASEA
jgi:hypothetical protein